MTVVVAGGYGDVSEWSAGLAGSTGIVAMAETGRVALHIIAMTNGWVRTRTGASHRDARSAQWPVAESALEARGLSAGQQSAALGQI